MKKLLCIALAVMVAVSLTACGEEALIEKVAGTWSVKIQEPEESALALMESIELFEEEIALVDTALYTVKTVTFNTDKTYSYAESADQVKECVKEFYMGMFDDLYEGRASLSACYEEDISTLSQEDFRQFYAELYSAENYDALIQKLADNAYVYEDIGVFETGTYSITGSRITMDTEGTENDGYVSYSVDGTTLTLDYTDSTEVYTKVS